MENIHTKKRVRVDSDSDSPSHDRVDSEDARPSSPARKQLRSSTESHNSTESSRVGSPESIRVLDDILDVPDEADVAAQELETVMKSFEEEINQSPKFPEVSVNFCYHLEGSDDEFGQPKVDSQEHERVVSNIEPMPSYELLDLDFSQLNSCEILFDNDSDDISEFVYRPESLHARW